MDNIISAPSSLLIPSRLTRTQSIAAPSRQRRFTVFAISSNDFKPGTEIELDGAPWRVQEFLHVKPGKGAAFVRTKLRNFITGTTLEKTFRAGENVDDARVDKELKQFTYRDGNHYVFMDTATFEEVRISAKDIGDKGKWLLDGMECYVLTWKERVIDVELPVTVKYKVIEAEGGVKGNTVQGGGSKQATLETGTVINVPLFVNVGEEIAVDTRTGSYLSRSK